MQLKTKRNNNKDRRTTQNGGRRHMNRRVLAIVLGASKWPACQTLPADRRFEAAAQAMYEYFAEPTGFHIDRSDLRWFFDDDSSADAIDRSIGDWIKERLEQDGQKADLVVVYYVGHGHLGTKNNELYLTTRATRSSNLEQSSIHCQSLANTLHGVAPSLPRLLLLDCCFAGAAVAAFQFIPAAAGTALLASAAAGDLGGLGTHKSREGTLFMLCLRRVLARGIAGGPDSLCLRELHAQMRMEVEISPSDFAEWNGPWIADPLQPPAGTSLASEVSVFPNLASPAWLSVAGNEAIAAIYRRIVAYDLKNIGRARRSSDDREAAIQSVDRRGQLRLLLGLALGIALIAAALTVGLIAIPRHIGQPTVIPVNPALGWHLVDFVDATERVCIQADGRVHLGLNQVVNLMNIAKPLVFEYAEPSRSLGMSPDEFASLRALYPWNPSYGRTLSRRAWTSPEGQDYADDILDDARLLPSCPWGALVAVVLPRTVDGIADQDPLLALRMGRREPTDIICVGAEHEIVPPIDGTLFVAVNDAVSSNVFPDERARSNELFRALRRASRASGAASGPGLKIDEAAIPLFWFADNGGALIVRASVGRCPGVAN